MTRPAVADSSGCKYLQGKGGVNRAQLCDRNVANVAPILRTEVAEARKADECRAACCAEAGRKHLVWYALPRYGEELYGGHFWIWSRKIAM